MKKHFLIFAPLAAVFCSTAYAQNVEVTGRCHLTYKDSVNARGTCKVHQVGDTVTINGTVEENGQRYLAIINNSKNEGVLLGAGTFTLADGMLASNESDEVRWRNGYELRLNLR